ncbi:hypothetical protein LWI29_001994 [Acer saccharum]|uniref:Uncharacterized protein n=1 Tax=Acer saccharum TaxID=4024 RepID=A0AA39RFB9_ACESA|nr:hypothetical protein LWI29_001994 [Acer saccharum]
MPQPPHVWAPHELIDPDHLAAYQAYKRNSTGELRDVDLHLPVDVLWFHRFQSNFMELEDTEPLKPEKHKMAQPAEMGGWFRRGQRSSWISATADGSGVRKLAAAAGEAADSWEGMAAAAGAREEGGAVEWSNTCKAVPVLA